MSPASDGAGQRGRAEHVHPFLSVAALAAMARAVMDGGTNASTAWWTS